MLEDGLLFSGMMIVSTQAFIPREGHPVSFWHSTCGPSSPDSGVSADKAAEDANISGLLGMLASIPDPRSPQGKQYPLEFTLAVCAVAMLAGAKNYTEIARHAADTPQSLLRKLGAKWNWFRFRYQWPGKSAIWNVLTRIDAAMMDRITGTWLAAQARKDEEGD
jgi:DDE_Tnp_1-associated